MTETPPADSEYWDGYLDRKASPNEPDMRPLSDSNDYMGGWYKADREIKLQERIDRQKKSDAESEYEASVENTGEEL